MAVASKTKKIFDNRYEVLSIVGRGSASVVYHARHINQPSAEVALKVLIDHKHDSSSADKLRKEALALISAKNRYVLRLDDFHSVGSLCYLCLEFAPESDLRKYSQELGGQLGVSQAELFLRQCAEALSVIHKAGIIHRDIKPDNVMVFNHREIRLGDFGIALMPGEEQSLEELQAGVGTMSYMAPEVLEGHHYDHRIDLYALGIMFYELLSGAHPFDNAPLLEQLEVRKNIPSLSSVAPSIPERITSIIDKLTAYEINDRCVDAYEIIQLLDATAPSTSSRRDSSARREPAAKIKPIHNSKKPSQSLPANLVSEIRSSHEQIAYADGSVAVQQEHVVNQNIYNSSYDAAPVQEFAANAAVNAYSPDTHSSALSENGNHSPSSNGSTHGSSTAKPKPIDLNKLGRLSADETIVLDEDILAELEESSKAENVFTGAAVRELEPAPVVYTSPTSYAQPKHEEQPIEANEDSSSEDAPISSAQYAVARAKKILLPIIIISAAIVILILKQQAARNSTIEGDESENIPQLTETLSVTDTGSTQAPATNGKILPSFSGTLAFPQLAPGIYRGTIARLVADTTLPLTMIAMQNGQVTVIVGLEGWTPRMVSPPEESAGDDPLGKPLKVASNGFILEFTGQAEDNEIIGTFRNRVNGDIGSWRLRAVKE